MVRSQLPMAGMHVFGSLTRRLMNTISSTKNGAQRNILRILCLYLILCIEIIFTIFCFKNFIYNNKINLFTNLVYLIIWYKGLYLNGQDIIFEVRGGRNKKIMIN